MAYHIHPTPIVIKPPAEPASPTGSKHMSEAITDIPAGYQALFRTSPFLDLTGPYYYQPLEQGFLVGLRVADKHCNVSGTAHGGLLATLADISLGYVTASSQQPPLRMTTTQLNLNYLGVVRLGDWLQAEVDVVKTGSRLAFANVTISVDNNPVATASAVFLVMGDK